MKEVTGLREGDRVVNVNPNSIRWCCRGVVEKVLRNGNVVRVRYLSGAVQDAPEYWFDITGREGEE